MYSDWNLENLLYLVYSKYLTAFTRVPIHMTNPKRLNAWYEKHIQQSHSHPVTMHPQHKTHNMSECQMHAVILSLQIRPSTRILFDFECGVYQ